MDELKMIIAANITALRTSSNMTQLTLSEKLNYSDKSISKWERGESVPDIYILKQMSELFGVSVDYFLHPHDNSPKACKKTLPYHTIIHLSVAGIWALAILLFVIFWIMGMPYFMIFFYAVPVSLLTYLILNSIWLNGKYSQLLVSALVFSIPVTVYFACFSFHWWQILLLIFPAELITFFCFRIKKKLKTSRLFKKEQ